MYYTHRDHTHTYIYTQTEKKKKAGADASETSVLGKQRQEDIWLLLASQTRQSSISRTRGRHKIYSTEIYAERRRKLTHLGVASTRTEKASLGSQGSTEVGSRTAEQASGRAGDVATAGLCGEWTLEQA